MNNTQKRNSARKNYLFNLTYQIFLIIVPIIVMPYVSRILTPDGIGAYSFSFSINTYFTSFAALGFATYGQRIISSKQNSTKDQTKVFWEIIICKMISSFISLCLNCLLIQIDYFKNYYNIMMILNINIISIAFDVTFFFQGNEEFSIIVIRNVIIRIISIVLIFVFVRNKSDLWIYALIQTGSSLLGNLSLWPYLKKRLCRINLFDLRPFNHLIGTLRLFIPTIATQIYVMIDKSLIGFLIKDTYSVVENGIETILKWSDFENGIYEQSEKIVKMTLTVLTSLGTVYLSRNSNEISKGNYEQFNKNIFESIHFTWMIGVPMMLGIICIAGNFVPWFLGKGFEKCSLLISIFAPLIIIIGFSNLFCYQILAPYHLDKYFLYGSFLGVIVNLILNLILIPLYWSLGAVIASVVSELIVTIFYYFCIKKLVNTKILFSSSIKYIISGLIMFGVTYPLSYFMSASIINTLLLIIVGIFSYILSLLVLKDSYLLDNVKILIKLIRRKR